MGKYVILYNVIKHCMLVFILVLHKDQKGKICKPHNLTSVMYVHYIAKSIGTPNEWFDNFRNFHEYKS